MKVLSVQEGRSNKFICSLWLILIQRLWTQVGGEKDDSIFFMKLLMIYKKYVYLFYELESVVR